MMREFVQYNELSYRFGLQVRAEWSTGSVRMDVIKTLDKSNYIVEHFCEDGIIIKLDPNFI